MRRVFPLKSSENCTYDYINAEELHEKEQSKLLDDHVKVNNQRIEYNIGQLGHGFEPNSVNDFELMRKLDSDLLNSKDSNTNNVDSGDENRPFHYIRQNSLDNNEVTSTKSSKFAMNNQNRPHRASAYPVFTASSSGRYSSLIIQSEKPRENARESARVEKQQRNSAMATSHQPSNSETKHARDSNTNKIKDSDGRPLGVPKNQPFLDQQENLRTSSVRTSQLPNWMTFPNAEDMDPEPGSPISDTLPPRPRSLSRTTSERSYSETSSDFSSCFTKTTESSSGRSMVSESIGSKKSSSSGKVSGGSAPFKYLNARMVAEKLVKVLGKEKLHWQSARPSYDEETNEASNHQEGNVFSEDPMERLDCKLSSTLVESMQRHGHNDHWLPWKDMDSSDTITSVTRKASFDEKTDVSNLQSLEARAIAREKMATNLEQDRSSCNDGRYGHMSSVEYVTLQDFDALKNEIRKLQREKRDLALEVAGEIRSRISEKKSALYASKCKDDEMERKLSAIEKDKASLQESLEREIERRSEEWQVKLSKIRAEERKLKERVTKMAEERSELQKIIASLKAKEASWIEETKDYEKSISTLKQRVQESEEKVMLQLSSSAELMNKLRSSDVELESITKKNKCLEIENFEMQKELTRLRRVCNDQEMSIEGLWQELDEAVNGSFECKSEHVVVLQRELLRLARAEQVVRNEVNALHSELSKLKEERGCDYPGDTADIIELNYDTQGRLAKLQTKVATLQEENRQLSSSLRAAIREKEDAERAMMLLQSEPKTQNGKKLEKFRMSEEEEDEEEEGAKLQFLQSKLKSREAELDQLDEEVADLINSRDSLQTEVDDLHEKLCTANHQIQELGKKIDSKEEVIETLRGEIEKYEKEKMQLENELPQVRRQRDEMGKEAAEMSKEVLRLTLEMAELRKIADKLEEEVMLKEGQISILRGSYTSTDYGLS